MSRDKKGRFTGGYHGGRRGGVQCPLCGRIVKETKPLISCPNCGYENIDIDLLRRNKELFKSMYCGTTWNKGKHWSKEIKQKISKSLKQRTPCYIRFYHWLCRFFRRPLSHEKQMKKFQKGRKKWWDSLSVEEKSEFQSGRKGGVE